MFGDTQMFEESITNNSNIILEIPEILIRIKMSILQNPFMNREFHFENFY